MGSKSGRSTARFAVGSSEGPRSNVWVLFTSKTHNDIYISMRSFADAVKVSLHESGSWRWAFTREHFSGSSPNVPPGKNRTMDEWTRPPEIAPGCVKAFRVSVPSSEVTMPQNPNLGQDRYAKKIHWVPPAPEGHGTWFTVVISGPEGVPDNVELNAGLRKYPAHPIWHAKLPKDDQMVWVLVHDQPISQRDREVIETARQEWHQFFKQKESTYELLENKRAFLYLTDREGTRMFVDLLMSE